MSTECYPITILPNVAKLYRDFVGMGEASRSPVGHWYGADPLGRTWTRAAPATAHSERLAAALEQQAVSFGVGQQTLDNISRLRAGARAIVTGQQVGLLGGPLLVLLKAATAVARAKQAEQASGIPHVPVFWCATEDHDLAEVEQITLLTKAGPETLHLSTEVTGSSPVGGVTLGPGIQEVVERARELLAYAPVCDLLSECYVPGQTYGSAFARFLSRLFAREGLIVMDAAGREFHSLGRSVLHGAIEHAAELETALLHRSSELEAGGYHAQVLVKPGASLLFYITDRGARMPLRRAADGTWRVGAGNSARQFSTADLLDVLDSEPERLSPNALLRPVFQDSILPTTAYIGGPAEIAYFAQSAVLYQELLGRITPILPRLSATLIEPAIGAVMASHEVSLPDALSSPEALAQRLGARAMPIEAKRRLAAAGNSLHDAINAAQQYLASVDPGLGRSAQVSASKMLYQMSRLRRLAANFELNKQESLRKHAGAMTSHLFPGGHPQERVIAAAWFIGAYEAAHGTPASEFIARLVMEAENQCPGHLVIRM